MNNVRKVGGQVKIRRARAGDLPALVALDERVTHVAKDEYWKDLFEQFAARQDHRMVLLAEVGGRVVGFIIGEVRAWEFGEPPCGWIFGANIDPDYRERGIGSALFEKVTLFFRECGVTKVRTMMRRDANLIMSFFRSQGLTSGPFIQLERDIDE